MMITKVEMFIVRGFKGAKITDFVLFRFKPLFCQSVPTNRTKLAEKCIWVSYKIPSNFKPKYWQKIFILEKNQNMWQSYFLGLFLAITPQTISRDDRI